MNIQEQIIASENRLIAAMKDSDVTVLAKLIHDDLLFVVPGGQVATKTMDLDAHRSGNMKVEAILAGERIINITDDTTAIVAAQVSLKGKYFDQPIDGEFRYLRVWKLVNGSWQIIAGSVSVIAG